MALSLLNRGGRSCANAGLWAGPVARAAIRIPC